MRRRWSGVNVQRSAMHRFALVPQFGSDRSKADKARACASVNSGLQFLDDLFELYLQV